MGRLAQIKPFIENHVKLVEKAQPGRLAQTIQ